mmetsp:Transcript_25697/g.102529  ORF Transcript_25697/g.102529 Transcript_25697/m.102529 type:complete len:242 (+) Transcript_25697:549-1274(+)
MLVVLMMVPIQAAAGATTALRSPGGEGRRPRRVAGRLARLGVVAVVRAVARRVRQVRHGSCEVRPVIAFRRRRRRPCEEVPPPRGGARRRRRRRPRRRVVAVAELAAVRGDHGLEVLRARGEHKSVRADALAADDEDHSVGAELVARGRVEERQERGVLDGVHDAAAREAHAVALAADVDRGVELEAAQPHVRFLDLVLFLGAQPGCRAPRRRPRMLLLLLLLLEKTPTSRSADTRGCAVL